MRIVDCEQRSEAWFQARAGRPTASEAAKILTSTGKKSTQWKGYMYRLVAERAGHAESFMEPTEAMLEGIRREQESIDAYAFMTGHEVTPVGLVICDKTGASCSPDGLVKSADTWIHGTEMKNPNPGTFYDELDADKVPAKYIPQLHFSLAVTGLPRWDYVCYIPNEAPIIHQVEPNDFTETMQQAIADFCGELDKTCERLGVPLIEEIKEAA